MMMKVLIPVILACVTLSTAKSIETEGESQRFKRNAWTARLYPNGKITYFIPTGGFSIPKSAKPLDAEKKSLVLKAMTFLSDNTCLKFESKPTDNDRLLFTQSNTTDPCIILGVGRKTSADTLIRISGGHLCSAWMPYMVRTIMHGIGFFAMSARPDVATYLNVNTRNINSSHTFNAALITEKRQAADLISPLPPFEFGSILSYPTDEFSDKSRPVFQAKSPYEMYQQSQGSGRVTFNDIQMINKAYCPSVCTAANTCVNDGYPNPSNCTQCLCPEGYGGPKCADVPTGDGSNRTQGEMLTASAVWQNRNIKFGQDPKIGLRTEPMNRVDWIQAPLGMKVEVKITDINADCNPGCKTAAVELKVVAKALAGPRICCLDQLNKTFVSDLNPTPVISYNRWSYTSFWISYRAGNAPTTTTTTTPKPTTTTTPITCYNGGTIDPSDNTKCICPGYTGGRHCEFRDA